MRDIKFRAKRKDNGEWTYGYVDATMYKDIVVIHTDNSTHEVDPKTVGQYTGVEDSNGKPIYEGDLLMLFKHTLVSVFYSPVDAMYKVSIVNSGERFCLSTCYPNSIVVGNVYDNPELIKEGGKE